MPVVRFHTVEEARQRARRRLPRMVFDYVDGAAGREHAAALNQSALDAIRMMPRGLVNVEERQLGKTFLGQDWGLPFGIAPMGMCNLTWPDADVMLAKAAVEFNIPVGLSTAGTSTIEDTYQRAGQHAWFQLYVGKSDELATQLVDRAEAAGYDTLILTIDVPQVAPRIRDLRNGFQAPLVIGPRQFIDFALHPNWSIRTLMAGVPEPVNFAASNASEKFVRNAGRGRIDWAWLDSLRKRWHGHLIVKGVLSTVDAVRLQAVGVDAIYISNHGGRKLDSAPPAIQQLPRIRAAVGEDYPLIFDSGVRTGEQIVKVLALGADFVMLGRPFLFGIGADGASGLQRLIELLVNEMSVAMAQIGAPSVGDITQSVLTD